MADVEAILWEIRLRQASTAALERVADGRSLDVILETRRAVDTKTLAPAIERALAVEFTLSPLFATAAAPADADLKRFHRLSVPAVAFPDLAASPFELAYHLQDALDLASAEPDVETEFFPEDDTRAATDLEAVDPLDCWVDIPPPADLGWALAAMRVPAAWAFSVQSGRPDRGRGILVAQPDTGVAEHHELRDAVDRGRAWDVLDDDADPTDPLDALPGTTPGHGVATASVLASRGGVEPGGLGTSAPGRVTGSAPEALIVPIRCIRSVVRVRQSSVARAVEHARRQGCHVITMSLGGLPSPALATAIRRAVDDNLIVLAAAGNCVQWVVWPARYDRCLAVGGTNVESAPWKGSSHGPDVDVSAPAELVWRAKRRAPADPLDEIDPGQGTSFAVALTAGVAGLWLAHHGRDALVASLAPGERLQDRFRAQVRRTARRPGGWNAREYGAGIVDAEALLRAGVGTPAPPALESAGAARRDEIACTSAFLTEVVRDLGPPSDIEAAAPIGLTPAELERHGPELGLALLQGHARPPPATLARVAGRRHRHAGSAHLERAARRAGTTRLRAAPAVARRGGGTVARTRRSVHHDEADLLHGDAVRCEGRRAARRGMRRRRSISTRSGTRRTCR